MPNITTMAQVATFTPHNYQELVNQDMQEMLHEFTAAKAKEMSSNLRAINYILRSDIQAKYYNAAFGNLHIAKLKVILAKATVAGKLSIDELNSYQKLNICDWGSGQGLATFTTIDYLKSIGYDPKFLNVLMVDASPLATNRAKELFNNTGISGSALVTQNLNLDWALDRKKIQFPEDGITIHLLSNFLDLVLDVEGFAEFIKGKIKGKAIFICAGVRSVNMHMFAKLVSGKMIYAAYETVSGQGLRYSGDKIDIANAGGYCSTLSFVIEG